MLLSEENYFFTFEQTLRLVQIQHIKLLILVLFFFLQENQNIMAQVNINTLHKDITLLSSDSLQGRLIGSEGEKMAANYIEKRFTEIGLAPLPKHNYKQNFSFKYTPLGHSKILNNDTITGINVIGYLDNQAKHTFVIGAHYDHLGRNEYNQSTDSHGEGQIHNGADDNASGVSAVLELARIYSTNEFIEPVNFIFACFSGEELGLIGSKFFAESLTKDYKNISLMINFDMIGRMDTLNTLHIGGIGTSPQFESINNLDHNFSIKLDSSGVGPSDHSSFYYQKIPVLFFFTGLHSDYHKPSDDSNKINYVKTAEIISFTQSVIDTLAQNSDLTFTPTKLKQKKETPTFKVTLGIFPDYTDYGDGLHITDVVEGKTADLNGLKRGDIITKIGDYNVTDIYSYMEALSHLQKNKSYRVDFIRNEASNHKKIKF